ncbi:MAG: hypothetical protein ACOYKA_07245, partial [Legionellaceae bacterium]
MGQAKFQALDKKLNDLRTNRSLTEADIGSLGQIYQVKSIEQLKEMTLLTQDLGPFSDDELKHIYRQAHVILCEFFAQKMNLSEEKKNILKNQTAGEVRQALEKHKGGLSRLPHPNVFKEYLEGKISPKIDHFQHVVRVVPVIQKAFRKFQERKKLKPAVSMSGGSGSSSSASSTQPATTPALSTTDELTRLKNRLLRLQRIEDIYYSPKKKPNWAEGPPSVTLQQMLDKVTQAMTDKSISLDIDATDKIILSRFNKIPGNIIMQVSETNDLGFHCALVQANTSVQPTVAPSTSKDRVIASASTVPTYKGAYVLTEEVVRFTKTYRGSDTVCLEEDTSSVNDKTPLTTAKKLTLEEDEESALQMAMVLLSRFDKRKPVIRLSGADAAQVTRVHAALLSLQASHADFKTMIIS